MKATIKVQIIIVSVMLIVCVMVSRTFQYCISMITLPLPIHKGEYSSFSASTYTIHALRQYPKQF